MNDMVMNEFMDQNELKLIHFSFQLTSEIKQKIQSKIFYYQNQIEKYAMKRIHLFISTLPLKPALKTVYYNQLLQLVTNRLKQLLHQHNVLKCM
ncbi:hypothetical protein [Bacillus sp. FJAT-47783]|uniref:hypothetical protein n=1 Tax=Bacillus sp. FJAT-47783 TaxID=2922712 RepID=UPI001FAD66AF|nr:hypothetical protein [Bacillus sp. FJAT-47783]